MTRGRKKGTREREESRRLIEGSFRIARALKIEKILVRADLISDINSVMESRDTESIVWISDVQPSDTSTGNGDKIVLVPDLRLSRISQVKLGLFVAVLRGYVEIEESILCLSGVAGSSRIDTVLITNPKRDFPWLQKDDMKIRSRGIATDVLEAVIQIALQISVGGHEGIPVGTIFVIGDHKELRPHLRQLILNPCAGHPAGVRSVYNPQFLDTIRELAALDGAFVVNRRGTVISAATYLDASSSGIRLRPGLGARHTSAAAITRETDSAAVVVSETTGAVNVFHEGKLIIELEKPEPRATRRAKSPAPPKAR